MAKRFTFRFETLLGLRRQREEERKRAVAVCLREVRRLEERQRRMLGQIDEQTEWTRRALRGDDVNVDRLKLGRHWLLRLRRGVLETQAQIATRKAILAQERQRLAESSKETKVLTRLKERRFERHRAEQDRREQAESDEMNVLRFAHAALAGMDEIA